MIDSTFLYVVIMLAGITFFGAAATQLAEVVLDNHKQTSSITSVNDLRNKSVATITGTTSFDYLISNGIKPIQFDSINKAILALENNDVDAIVFDEPVLKYEITKSSNSSLALSGERLKDEYYGIAFSQNSELREEFNRALLSLTENGEYKRIYKKWLTK
jgi:ABC-type amino acid transport substrate-binding protein